MGSYLTYNAYFQFTGRMDFSRILVHLDLLDGLSEYINIQWRNATRRQMLDYEGVPFRCRRCHKVGHLFRDCPLIGWNFRKVARQAPKEFQEQEAQSHGGLAREEQPKASEEMPQNNIPQSRGSATMSDSWIMASTPSQTIPRK